MSSVVVCMIKLQEHFLLARRTEPAGEARSAVTPRIRHKAHLPLMCSAIGASPELHGHQASGADFRQCSDSRKRPTYVLKWFNYKPTLSGWDQGRGFPLWVMEGIEVGPVNSSTLQATGVDWVHCVRFVPLKDSMSAVVDCANGLRDLCRCPPFWSSLAVSRNGDKSCFCCVCRTIQVSARSQPPALKTIRGVSFLLTLTYTIWLVTWKLLQELQRYFEYYFPERRQCPAWIR